MSLEHAKEFLKKMQEDDTFSKSFFSCSELEARRSFLKEQGFDFTKEEITQAREGLSDPEVEKITGGASDGLGAIIASIFKFKQHKDNPIQIPGISYSD